MNEKEAKPKFCPTCGYCWTRKENASHKCVRHMLKKSAVLKAIEKTNIPQSIKDSLRKELGI